MKTKRKLSCSCTTYLPIWFVFSGVLMLCFFSKFVDYVIDHTLRLNENASLTHQWSDPSIPMNLEVYFFNWTNPEELKLGKKLNFKEMGPYSFKQVTKRVNITWNLNDTVTYRNLKYWYFDKKASSGDDNDIITSLNAIPFFAAARSKSWSYWSRKILSLTLTSHGTKTYMQKGVTESLFQGYHDPLLDLTNQFPFFSNEGLFDKFAWFYNRNGSYNFDGALNIGTGNGNTTLGQLYMWNYKPKSHAFKGSCGAVNGSGDAIFYPRNTDKTAIEFFFTEMCRKVVLDYESEAYDNGVWGYKFSADKSFLDNGTAVPQTKCYFQHKRLVRYGMTDHSSCTFDIPSYVSLPHFYKADPFYVDAIKGMKPEKSKHEMYTTIHTRTGIPIKMLARVQLNLLLSPHKDISLYRDLPEVYFPILWFQAEYNLPEENKFMLQLLNYEPLISKLLSYTLIFIGLILAMYLIVKHNYHKKHMWQKQELIILHKELAPLKCQGQNGIST